MRILSAFLLLLPVSRAFAWVDAAGNSISNDFQLIGVIHENRIEKSLAMVREVATKNACTLRIGDALPHHTSFFVIEINKGYITASDGTKRVLIISGNSTYSDHNDEKEYNPSPINDECCEPSDEELKERVFDDDMVRGIENVERYIQEINTT